TVSFEPAQHPALHPGRGARVMKDGEEAGWLGTLHPALQHELELRRPVLLFSLRLDVACRADVPSFRPYSKYPAVRRDLALIFDVYTGSGIEAGRKSIALGLILQGVSRTLTDADADKAVGAVIDRLERELGARIRN